MFCPNCGNSDQLPETYCRRCGSFLNDPGGKNQLAFGGATPEEKINVNLFLNFLSAVVSLILMIALYASFIGKRGEFPVIYVVAAFLCAMSFWQFSTFYVGLKLKKIFKQRTNALETVDSPTLSEQQTKSSATGKILPAKDLIDFANSSVTENTTRNLEKIPRS